MLADCRLASAVRGHTSAGTRVHPDKRVRHAQQAVIWGGEIDGKLSRVSGEVSARLQLVLVTWAVVLKGALDGRALATRLTLA